MCGFSKQIFRSISKGSFLSCMDVLMTDNESSVLFFSVTWLTSTKWNVFVAVIVNDLQR